MAVISSIGAFECKFVMATIPSNERRENPETEPETEIGVDHVSGTEDELDSVLDWYADYLK